MVSLRVCVCVRLHDVGMWTCHPEPNKLSDSTQCPLWFVKHARSTAMGEKQQQQQRSSHNILHNTPGTQERFSPPFSTCDTPGISSQQHPEGEPCTYYIYIYRMYKQGISQNIKCLQIATRIIRIASPFSGPLCSIHGQHIVSTIVVLAEERTLLSILWRLTYVQR